MNLQELLKLTEFKQNDSEAIYKENVLKTVDILLKLGIKLDDPSDLKTSVESILQTLQDKEIELYGRKISKQEIIEEIKLFEQKIAELEREKAEIEQRIANIKAQSSA